MIISIETPRLHLKTLEELDVSQDYVDWLNDSVVNKFLETRHNHQTLNSCKDFVKGCLSSPSENLFGAFLKEGNIHIGNVKLGFINHVHSRGQISLVVGDKSQWGKGYGSEMVRAVTKYGFEQLHLNRIEAGCYEENISSLRIFLKAGYTVEGFFREHSLVSNGQRAGCFWLAILRHEFERNCCE